MNVVRLPRVRPPCSAGERTSARMMAQSFAALGLEARLEGFRAATSPTWIPLVRAVARLGAGLLIVLGQPEAAIAFAVLAVVGGTPPIRRLVRFLPGFGGQSQNVVTHITGHGPDDQPPLVVVAHVDLHPTAGAPLVRYHRFAAVAAGWVVLGAAIGNLVGGQRFWETPAMIVAVESLITLAWLGGRELMAPRPGDDNDAALAALVRVAELARDGAPVRDLWLVATGAATADGSGMRSFLQTHPDVARVAWVVEVDNLGDGELVVCPARRRFPHKRTAPAVVRAMAGAAMDIGDPIDIRRMPRPHSDARAALVAGSPALSLTGGVRPPTPVPPEADPANAERAARIVDHLARTVL